MKLKNRLTILFMLCIAITLNACSIDHSEKEDMLTVGVTSLSGTFNPIYAATVYDSYVTDLVYDTLLSRDFKGNRCAALAMELPQISDDYKTYTFHLRENVKFSNGELLTAEDVAFSFTVLADPTYDGAYSSIVYNLVGYEEYHKNETDTISGIEIVDDNTIVFHFKEGFRTNIDSLASLGIMSKRSYPTYEKGNLKALKDTVDKPIGSGPYILKEWASDTGALLLKNEYYDRGGYEIETINMKPINPSSMMLELEKGSIDALVEVNSPDLISAANNHHDMKINAYPNAGISWLTLNCESGITADIKVRKALTLAFDRDAFVNHYFECDDCNNQVTLAYVPSIFQNPISSLHDYVIGSTQVEGLEDDRFNLKAANTLLDDSGWIKGKDGIRYKDHQKLTLKMMVADEQQTAQTLVPMWKKDWASIGVDLKITTVDFNTMINKVTNDDEINDWNAFVLSSVFSSDDLDSIYTIFHSSAAQNGGNNLARLRNSEIDAMLDQGRAELNLNNVDDIYLKTAVLIHNQFANIPIYGTQNFDIYNKRLQNFNTSSYFAWTKALKDAKLK